MKTHVTINGKEFELFKPVFIGVDLDDNGDIRDNYAMDRRDEVFNELLLALDGLSFEKKEEQKPFSVDNPPRYGEQYWHIFWHNEGEMDAFSTKSVDGKFDKCLISQNNCFRTREEAEAALKRVLQTLKS